MKLQHRHPAEDWQKRFVIFDQKASSCPVVSPPAMLSSAMSACHGTRILVSHSCDMEKTPTTPTLPSASFPNLMNLSSNGDEVNLHCFNSRETVFCRSFEKCNWKLLEDVPEDESGSQASSASNPWRERSEDIDALLSSDEELSTGRSPIVAENINTEQKSNLNKLELSDGEDQEVNSKPSTCNLFNDNQFFGSPIKSQKTRHKRKRVCHCQKPKSVQGRASSFKNSSRRKSICVNLDCLGKG